MAEPTFTPVLYLKAKCPFCLKLRLFLLEAGLGDRFVIEEIGPESANEATVRALLTARCGSVSFPTAEIAPGVYLTESDAIIRHYADAAGVTPEACPVFQSYVTGVLPRLLELYREVAALKAPAA